MPAASVMDGTAKVASELPQWPVREHYALSLPDRTGAQLPEIEPFHWKGLILQSLAFDLLQNATRIATASQKDRRLLLNKPFWSNYWASLGQFNMRRWNDGDSIKVNYIGHPMQGAITGYIEVQNDPGGRSLKISRDRSYWNSRFRAFLWSTAYSTMWEIGPIGETAIFNQGGFTYPIRCSKKKPEAPDYCEKPTATYTNNTGWVDFIITPIGGTLWLLGEDALDRYISDPLVQRHPKSFGYKVVRSSLNPSRSLANMLRGRYPWYRDYEHPTEYQSPIYGRFERAMREQPVQHVDLHPHWAALSVQTNHSTCMSCRTTITGGGLELGIALRRYIDFVSDVSVYPEASPLVSLNVGGSLTTATFGLRSGYTFDHFALKGSLSPGFASYSRTGTDGTAPKRNFNFVATAAIEGDVRLSRYFALRATVQQTLIRYKSPYRDPDGIGTPPRLSFLSHDNYINSTNWGVRVGPVIMF